jgi:mono/diheme cytochrome c family protein
MARTRTAAVVALLMATGLACEKHEFEPPDRVERVAQADSLFQPAMFDSITWPTDEARLTAGNEVFTAECRRCHGTVGEGDTQYARSRDLHPPSLVRADWPEGDSLHAVRRRVFTGHPDGMPSFGVGSLTARQIDAVSFYIVNRLRPEFAGSGATR